MDFLLEAGDQFAVGGDQGLLGFDFGCDHLLLHQRWEGNFELSDESERDELASRTAGVPIKSALHCSGVEYVFEEPVIHLTSLGKLDQGDILHRIFAGSIRYHWIANRADHRHQQITSIDLGAFVDRVEVFAANQITSVK